ncbi:MAG: hypothetical protein ACNA8P_12190, partial [Phycisphaerales bacterium]
MFNTRSRLITLSLPAILIGASATVIAADANRSTIPSLPTSSEFVIRDTLAELHPDVFTYMQHIVTLSNPFMDGRAADTRGKQIAAEYIEWYFKRMGFEPGFTPHVPDPCPETGHGNLDNGETCAEPAPFDDETHVDAEPCP